MSTNGAPSSVAQPASMKSPACSSEQWSSKQWNSEQWSHTQWNSHHDDSENHCPSSVAQPAFSTSPADRCNLAFDEYRSRLENALQQCQYIWRDVGDCEQSQRKSWRSTWGTIQHKLKGAFHAICEYKAPRLSDKQVNDLTAEVQLLRRKPATTQEEQTLEVLLENMSQSAAAVVAWSMVLDVVSQVQDVERPDVECIEIAQRKLDVFWHQLRKTASDASFMRSNCNH
jgi:hypothetical protein